MNPLVSVGVVSYNSSQYVIETLESIKNQNYKQIELVISDDCSHDDTVEICRKWVAENKMYFTDCTIIESEKNTGIPANCNRCINASSGKWIKLIAADDVLTENCINDMIDFAVKNPSAKAIHSQSKYYQDNFDESNLMHTSDATNELFNNIKISPSQQFKILLQGCHVNTPTVMIMKEVYENLGGFDEAIKTVEDWPMWLNLTKNGVKFWYLPKVTVKYRVHSKSATYIDRDAMLITKQQLMEADVYERYISGELTGVRKFLEEAENKRVRFLPKMGFRKRTFIGKMINFTTYTLLNFFRVRVKKSELKKLSTEI